MQAVLSLGLGYFIGCINPAAWISRKKKVNLKEEGTGNLGATNTALVLGQKAGWFVLIFDMLKSIFSYKMLNIVCLDIRYRHQYFKSIFAYKLISLVGKAFAESLAVFDIGFALCQIASAFQG